MAARVISRSYSAGLLKNGNRIAVQKVKKIAFFLHGISFESGKNPQKKNFGQSSKWFESVCVMALEHSIQYEVMLFARIRQNCKRNALFMCEFDGLFAINLEWKLTPHEMIKLCDWICVDVVNFPCKHLTDLLIFKQIHYITQWHSVPETDWPYQTLHNEWNFFLTFQVNSFSTGPTLKVDKKVSI